MGVMGSVSETVQILDMLRKYYYIKKMNLHQKLLKGVIG
jgi:hypothetical protein